MRDILKYMLGLAVAIMLMVPLPAQAKDTNVYVIDDADLLSSEEEAELQIYLESLSVDYNYMAITAEYNDYENTHALADAYYTDIYTMNDPGVVFIIDMDNRQIFLSGHGTAKKNLSDADALDVTDNIYNYASKGEYYSCFVKGFNQVNTLLNAGFILRPMRYIVAALLSIVFGFLLTFFWAMSENRKASARATDRMAAAVIAGAAIGASAVIYDSKRTRHASDSGSSGGGGWSSGGGGFSGGGSSSSGGGHSF